MDFRILGPLEVDEGGRTLRLGTRKHEALLAVLLLHANEVVSRERLIDELWGHTPPATADKAIQGYVWQLRKALGDAAAIATARGGYVLRLSHEQLDAARFERLAALARQRQASAETEAACTSFREALSLWRGPVLAGLTFESGAQNEVERLEGLRLAARMDLLDCELALGRHEQVVGELELLAKNHPLHERLSQQLMLALYRSGRQADALHVYREARETFVSQLGIEPGRPLRELEAAILRQDAALAPSLPAPRLPVARSAQPRAGEARKTLAITSSDVVSSTELSEAAGERRIVSVLVADVAGSTSIAEKLGPERSRFLCEEVVRLMGGEVERFGGTVAQLTGDGILALFGAPTAHEDDSERAVRAALAIREALDDYAADVAPAYGIELRARVAVNTGPVVVPAGDAPPHILYNALGDTVNVAARLQALGDVVLGPATAHQVDELFQLDELGDLELKGKSERVVAFRVVGIRAQTAAHPGHPLVGREEELAALTDVLDGLLDGRGAVVSITGEPGIGKSRLVAEVEKRFAGRVRFLAGHAVSYTEAIPYWPVRELLRGWLGLGVSDSEARVRLELRAELARTLADEPKEAYLFLATLLGLVLEPEQEQRLSDFASDAVQHQTFDWLYRLVCALARERPLCLVLEDLHWADGATLSLLDELLPAAEQTAVAFLLVHRSDPDPAWQLIDRARRRFRRLFFELELEPLSDVDARALAGADAGGELREELAQLLAERAGGNPYFVGEAIRDLRERGALERENGRLALVGDVSIPAALQEALQARLDRLDSEARELLTTAAVIGRSFGLPLLERLLPRARLLPTLSELQWLQLVVEERSGAAPEYRFRHGLVQEVAYGMLGEARRRELHLRVGEALVELHRDSPAEVYGLLAHHFAEADEPERAVEYLLKAGDAARAVYAEQEAIELYRRALEFMERTEEESRARQTLLKIALTYHLAFDYHAANEAFGEAFAKRAPALQRLEPSERITLATPAGWPDEEVAPGLNVSDMANWVTRNLFRGLVAIVRDLDIEPDLAERFTVSDDGRSYRFTLRSDARWSDGAPVTADDFEFTFAQMVEDDVASASWLDGVDAKAVNSRILEIRLEEPRSHFLYLLGQAALFAWPRHIYERRGRDWYRDVPLVGSGPFVLTRRLTRPASRSPGRMTIESAPAWYGARGNVGQVTIELEPSPPDAGDRWRAGEYHVIYDFVAKHAGLFADEETVVQQAPAGYTDYLGLDARRAPLDDVRVRRALAHAIDRHGVSQALGGTAAATGGVLPPAMPGHSHRIAPAFDPDRARALLSEAGHPGGRGLGEIVLAHFRIEEETACVIASQLAAVGVRVRSLPANSYDSLLAAIKERAHAHVWAFDYTFPDPGGGFLEPFLRWGPWLYRDDRLEQLLNRATAVRDQDERLRTCREFERIWIGEQAAVVPLAYNNRKLWRRPWVTGLWVNAIATSTFADTVVRRPDSGREADALEHAETV